MTRSLLLPLVLIFACDGADKEHSGPADDTDVPFVDNDGDGVPAGTDCDDDDEYTYPGAREVPYDGRDQDCDGADVTDVDGDGHDGDAVGGDDCNDSNPEVYPGAPVVCYDLIDEDCSEEGWSQYDCDEDGYDVGEDCGDEDPAIYPGAPDEWYDGVDSDCDARDDFDQDEDGFGSAGHADGSGAYGDDCDDLDATIHPDADEIWDGRDNDCAGGLDLLTNRNTSSSWYGDGYLGESYFGWDFAPVGDLDGDGWEDLVVGVLGYNDFTGRAYVVPYGEGLETPSSTALATLDGTSYLGSAVSGVRGAGGAPYVAIAAAGEASVYVFDGADMTGGASLSTGDAVVTLASSSYYLGGSLGSWTDADGADALLVSSFPVEGGGMYVGLYEVGALSGSVNENGALWRWEASGDAYDAAVLADLDGDGVGEIGMATSGFNGVPRVYVATGALVAEGGEDTATASLTGFAGTVLLSSAVDVDGDGYGEYLISDTLADGAEEGAGKVWVVGGPAALTGGAVDEVATATIAGAAEDGALRAARAATDVDGDAVPDLIVCAPGDGASSIKGGCSWVSGAAIAGGGEHAPSTEGPTFSSVGYDDQYGNDALPWDMDGDGDDDLLVSGIGDAGAVFLYLRR